MRFANGAARQQGAVVLGDINLTRLAAQLVDARVEGSVAAARGVHRQGTNHQCRLQHRLKAEQGVQRQRSGGLGAIDQRQSFLGAERQRFYAGLFQGRRSGHALAVNQHVAFADQRQRHVRQRCQVAGGTDRALRGHIGHEPGVVHSEQGVDHHFAHAGVTTRQAGGLEREHQAHDLGRQRCTDTDAVGADQIELQGVELGLADALVGQFAETCVDTVDWRLAVGSVLHDLLAGADRPAARRRQCQRHKPGMDGLKLFQRQAAGLDRDGIHGFVCFVGGFDKQLFRFSVFVYTTWFSQGKP